MPSSRLPFPGADAPNKRSRPDAPAESTDSEAVPTLLDHSDPVFKHFEWYEKGSGKNYTGCCVHCKTVLNGFKPGRTKAHLGKTKGNGINLCGKVPEQVHDIYTIALAVSSAQAFQRHLKRLVRLDF